MADFPLDLREQFTSDLVVGMTDRGLGRVDYAILVRDQNAIVAELRGAHVEVVDGKNVVHLLPHLENALLFANAPTLFACCKEVYMMLKNFDDISGWPSRANLEATLQRIEVTLRASVPQQESAAEKQKRMHLEGCGGEAGCICPAD